MARLRGSHVPAQSQPLIYPKERGTVYCKSIIRLMTRFSNCNGVPPATLLALGVLVVVHYGFFIPPTYLVKALFGKPNLRNFAILLPCCAGHALTVLKRAAMCRDRAA